MSLYRKGRRFEYEVKKELEKRGWVVLRCARSKPFDLVALKGVEDGRTLALLVECKVNSYVRREQRVLQEELARRAGAVYLVVTKDEEWRRKLREALRSVEAGARRQPA